MDDIVWENKISRINVTCCLERFLSFYKIQDFCPSASGAIHPAEVVVAEKRVSTEDCVMFAISMS